MKKFQQQSLDESGGSFGKPSRFRFTREENESSCGRALSGKFQKMRGRAGNGVVKVESEKFFRLLRPSFTVALISTRNDKIAGGNCA